MAFLCPNPPENAQRSGVLNGGKMLVISPNYSLSLCPTPKNRPSFVDLLRNTVGSSTSFSSFTRESALLSPPCSETPLIWGNLSSFPSTTWTNQNTTEKKTIQQTIFNYFIPFVHPSSSHLVRPFLVHSHPEPCSCSRSLPGKGICFAFFCCCFSLSHFSDFVGRHFWTLLFTCSP